MSEAPSDLEVNLDNSSPLKSLRSKLVKIGEFLCLQTLALVIFVGFPAFFTAMAPVSRIHFARRDGQVQATTRTYLLFIVPYKTQVVSHVVGIGDRFVAGSYSRERRSGTTDRVTKSEDQGYLVIHGNDVAGNNTTAEVLVTPHNIKGVVQQAQAFMNDSQAGEMTLFVVANWKFSVFAGGLISLLTLFYMGTIVFGLFLKSIHLLQRAAGVPPQKRWLVKYLF